ncbi:hypothetical protein [Hyphomicrobium sp.]|jgi:hypothetical protein|uniref:hypothetical protein n=1 Tax=Hyphomicrobium sp. TaxID=82 RepID=UPI00356AF55C
MTGDLPQKPPANSGTELSAAQAKRKARLAEELRANLKRRKAAARRHKGDEDGHGGTSSDNDEG